MGALSISHWLIILVLIILLFGAKKIPDLAKGLGEGIKHFKKITQENESEIKELKGEGEMAKKI